MVTYSFASSKELSVNKLKLLKTFCDDHGMVKNETKTKIMVINGSVNDRVPV